MGSGRLRFEKATPSGNIVTIVIPEAMVGSISAPGKPAQIVRKFAGVAGFPGESGLNRFFLPVNPDNPCERYKGVASCKSIGSEEVNGRQTTKWEFTHGLGGREWVTYEWIDSELHIAVKRQFESHITELRDIQEKPQPAALFDIPSLPGKHPL